MAENPLLFAEQGLSFLHQCEEMLFFEVCFIQFNLVPHIFEKQSLSMVSYNKLVLFKIFPYHFPLRMSI